MIPNIMTDKKGSLNPIIGIIAVGIIAVGIFLFIEYSPSKNGGAIPQYTPPDNVIVDRTPPTIDCGSIPPWGIARLDLEGAIESGDLSTARESYVKLLKYYDESRYCVSKEHMEFVAPKKKMDSLKKNLDNGDLNSAQDDLYYLASSCGAAICHRKKESMVELELSYFDIKDNVADGDLTGAKNSFMAFQKAYYSTKDEFRRIMPSQSKMMDDKYMENLENALGNNDLVASKRAVAELQDGVCSSNGCHGGMIP